MYQTYTGVSSLEVLLYQQFLWLPAYISVPNLLEYAYFLKPYSLLWDLGLTIFLSGT